MRKRVRKPLAFLMALLMTMSVFGSQVMAEGTPSSDAAVVTQGDEGAAGDAASAEAEGNDSGQSVQADNAKSAGQQGEEENRMPVRQTLRARMLRVQTDRIRTSRVRTARTLMHRVRTRREATAVLTSRWNMFRRSSLTV